MTWVALVAFLLVAGAVVVPLGMAGQAWFEGVLERRYARRDERIAARVERANRRVEELIHQNPEASWREIEALLRAEHLM